MKKKLYKTWRILLVIISAILFLLVFGFVSTKNAPPDTQFMEIES